MHPTLYTEIYDWSIQTTVHQKLYWCHQDSTSTWQPQTGVFWCEITVHQYSTSTGTETAINNSTLQLYILLESLYGGQFTLSTPFIKPNFCILLPHRRSTTVSLETTLFNIEQECGIFYSYFFDENFQQKCLADSYLTLGSFHTCSIAAISASDILKWAFSCYEKKLFLRHSLFDSWPVQHLQQLCTCKWTTNTDHWTCVLPSWRSVVKPNCLNISQISLRSDNFSTRNIFDFSRLFPINALLSLL